MAEKNQIAEDLQNLQRRNQQLIEEVERLRRNDFVHVERPSSYAPQTSANDVSAEFREMFLWFGLFFVLLILGIK